MNIRKFSELKKKPNIKLIKENDQFETQEVSNATEPVVEQSDCAKLFSKMFESREMAHIYHLQVKGDQGSYAKHMALGSFYEGVLDLIDDLVETYQGQYGIVDGYDVIDTTETRTKEPVAYFEELAEFIKHGRKCISPEDTHLHNIIDEVVAITYKTLYKLKFNS